MIKQYKTLSEKLFKKGFWLYLFSLMIAPLSYIIKIVLSTQLSTEELWVIYWIISLVTILWSFNDFWVTESLKHFIPSYTAKQKYNKIKSMIAYSFLMQLITSLIIASIFYFWSEIIALKYFESEMASTSIKIFSLFFIWINLFQIISTFLMWVQDTFWSKLVDFVRLFFSLTFISIITFLDMWNLVIYSWAWIVWLYTWILFWSIVFFIKYYLPYMKNEKIIWNKELFKKVFKYALLVFLWAQAWTLLSQIDMQMIILLLWSADAWYYTVYLSIITIPFLIITPIFQLLLPLFSELYFENKIEKIKKLKDLLYKLFVTIWIFTSLFFFTFSWEISHILFWKSYTLSWEIIKYSIPFLIFNFLLQINFNILASIWKVSSRVKIMSIAIIFNVIFNLFFIKWIWLYWAALATWMWWLLIRILTEIDLWQEYKTNFNYRFIWKNLTSMWLLWIISYSLAGSLFGWLWRLHSLCLVILFFIFRLVVFALVNYKESWRIILEISKLKKKN